MFDPLWQNFPDPCMVLDNDKILVNKTWNLWSDKVLDNQIWDPWQNNVNFQLALVQQDTGQRRDTGKYDLKPLIR